MALATSRCRSPPQAPFGVSRRERPSCVVTSSRSSAVTNTDNNENLARSEISQNSSGVIENISLQRYPFIDITNTTFERETNH